MNPVDAVRLMARHYPGGVDALAVLLGKSGETLRKEIAGAQHYKLGVNDACAISDACIAVNSEHCRAYANAVAANCGGFVRLEVREMAAPKATLLEATVGLVRGSSDVLASVTSARADGKISDNERRDIERRANEVIEHMQALLREVAKENAACRPVRVA